MRFNLEDGFPMLTTKKLHLKSIIHELIWFLNGDTNITYLNQHGVRIWNEWADENGELGPVYGEQWRSWPAGDGETIDQIVNLVSGLKDNPDSRRHLVTAWNPSVLRKWHCRHVIVFFSFMLRMENYRVSCTSEARISF